MLAIALQRAKARDGGKTQFVGQQQQLLFEMESEFAEELFQNFQGSHSIACPRQGSQNNGALSHVAMLPA